MSIEREVAHEIWRGKNFTLDVFFLTSESVCIKGLRGSDLTIRDFIEIAGILAREGFERIIYDTMQDSGRTIEKVVALTERFKKCKGGYTRLR